MGAFDVNKLDAVTIAWLATADSLGLPPIEYQKVLDWTRSHIDYIQGTGDSFAYGVFDETSGDAVAIVDIVHTTKSGPDKGWLKMLNITFGPQLAPSQSESAQPLEIYHAAITGTISLSGELPSRVIKLFGRDSYLMNLFAGLHYHISKTDGSSFGSKIEGRWLVISVK